VLTSLFVKTLNSKEIFEEILFPSIIRKILPSAFLLRFKAKYLEKNTWLGPFFVDSSSPCKGLLFLRGPNLAQKPLYSAGNVFKWPLSSDESNHSFTIQTR